MQKLVYEEKTIVIDLVLSWLCNDICPLKVMSQIITDPILESVPQMSRVRGLRM